MTPPSMSRIPWRNCWEARVKNDPAEDEKTMTKDKTTLSNRIRYAFDRTLSKGPWALGLWLAAISLLFAILMTLLVLLLRSSPGMDLGQLFYTVLLQALVPNPVDPKSGSWAFLIVMLVVTVGGLFIFSIFIGIFTTTIDDRVQSLRKGRSLVLEKNHTIILGWSPQIFPIISELGIANENHPGRCAVILADKDKVEMEDEIKARVRNTLNTRIVCRSGDPMDVNDLEIVSPQTCRAIIVLATNFQYHDAEVIKTILALINHPSRRSAPYHIVGSLRNPASQEIAQLITRGGEVVLFQVDNLISHITAQTCRQSGLSMVYEELLDFSGDEIYFKQEPGLTGKTFGEALFCYEDSALMGIVTQEEGVRLNPPAETLIKTGDKIIAISEDDDTIQLSNQMEYKIDPAIIQIKQPAPLKAERTLVLGWNRRAPLIVEFLDQYAASDSEVLVVAEVEGLENEISALAPKIVNQRLSFQRAETSNRQVLESLGLESFDHVIILSYSPDQDIQRADSRTMMSLLHLRDIANKRGHPLAIVSEILDIRNRDLIEIARVDDFIVSDRLVSLAMTQLSENKQILEVFRDLFDPQGSEIYLKPVDEYIRLDQAVNFYTLLEAARQRQEIAIGYRLLDEVQDAAKGFGIHLNPRKSESISFSAGDRLIVLAEKQS
jgi:voltage-gated potassium channel Kch